MYDLAYFQVLHRGLHLFLGGTLQKNVEVTGPGRSPGNFLPEDDDGCDFHKDLKVGERWNLSRRWPRRG
jgi:hypothetical protein